MPSYAPQVGAAAGGGLLGALGRLVEPLDYPRQALWNTVRGAGRALSGEGTWDDLLGALPGLLGAGAAVATGGLGLAPMLAAGAAQGLGKASGAEAFDAANVSDLTGTDEFLPNLLAGALTDPLTFAGAGAGARMARPAMGAGNMERAALQHGPDMWAASGLPAMEREGMAMARKAKPVAPVPTPEEMRQAVLSMNAGWQGDKFTKINAAADALRGTVVPNEQAIQGAVNAAMSAHTNPFSRLNIADLYEKIGKPNGLTIPEFQAALLHMQDAKGVRLGPYTQALAEHPAAEFLLPADSEFKFYLERPR